MLDLDKMNWFRINQLIRNNMYTQFYTVKTFSTILSRVLRQFGKSKHIFLETCMYTYFRFFLVLVWTHYAVFENVRHSWDGQNVRITVAGKTTDIFWIYYVLWWFKCQQWKSLRQILAHNLHKYIADPFWICNWFQTKYSKLIYSLMVDPKTSVYLALRPRQ